MGILPSTIVKGVFFLHLHLIDKKTSSAQIICHIFLYSFFLLAYEAKWGEERVKGCFFAIIMSITLTLLCLSYAQTMSLGGGRGRKSKDGFWE